LDAFLEAVPAVCLKVAMFVYFYYVPKKQHSLYEKSAGNFLVQKIDGVGGYFI
jgi:hypothetical protein